MMQYNTFALKKKGEVNSGVKIMIDKPVTIPEELKPQPIANIHQPAGFWIRSGAFAIDLLLVYIIQHMLRIEEIAYMFVTVCIGIYIFPLFIWKGQTLGKRMAGIIVVNNNGAQLSPSQIIVRYAISHVASILLLLFYTSQSISFLSLNFQLVLGFILFMTWFMPTAFYNKRALHDYITGARVVYLHRVGLLRKVIVICTGAPVITVFVLISIVTLHGSIDPLFDDSLEPNDNLQSATRLVPGKTIKGRAIEDNHDIFSIEAKAGQTIVFNLEDPIISKEPRFRVIGPGNEILYKDTDKVFAERIHPKYDLPAGSTDDEYAKWMTDAITPPKTTLPSGVTFEEIKKYGFKIHVPAKVSGIYYLEILERKLNHSQTPINIWSYHLTVSIE